MYFLVLPLLFLATGIIVSFRKTIQRKAVGLVLVTLGGIEVISFLSLIQMNMRSGFGFPLGLAVSLTVALATLSIGILSFYASKPRPNKA